MLVMLFGMVTLVSPLQFRNALFPMLMTGKPLSSDKSSTELTELLQFVTEYAVLFWLSE